MIFQTHKQPRKDISPYGPKYSLTGTFSKGVHQPQNRKHKVGSGSASFMNLCPGETK